MSAIVSCIIASFGFSFESALLSCSNVKTKKSCFVGCNSYQSFLLGKFQFESVIKEYRNIIFYYLCVFFRTYNAYKKVSRPRELPPKSLSELYVNLSAHTAPIIQPLAVFQTSNVQTDFFLLSLFLLTSVQPSSLSSVSYIFSLPSI